VAELRAAGYTLPIIAVTAERSHGPLLAAGFSHVVEKPFTRAYYTVRSCLSGWTECCSVSCAATNLADAMIRYLGDPRVLPGPTEAVAPTAAASGSGHVSTVSANTRTSIAAAHRDAPLSIPILSGGTLAGTRTSSAAANAALPSRGTASGDATSPTAGGALSAASPAAKSPPAGWLMPLV
jgi:hypothetical protein